jgi:tight adherence protein C
MTFWLMFGFFFCVMAAVTMAGYVYMRIKPAEFAVDSSGPSLTHANDHWFTDVLMAAGNLVSRPGKGADDLRKLLFRAGYRSPTAISVFRGAQILASVVFGLTTVWLATVFKSGIGEALLAGICALGFGFMLLPRLLEYQVRARAQRVRVAVPPALDLLVLAMEAGQSLDQALQETSSTIKPTYPDLSSELVFCHLEMRAGTARPEALRRLGERSGEDELRKLATVLIDGERFGSSLGPALRTHAHYLRTRMRQRAQEAARKLAVKLVIPVFFLIFPSVMLVTLGPAYIQLRGFLDNFMK